MILCSEHVLIQFLFSEVSHFLRRKSSKLSLCRIDTPRTCWGSSYSGHFGWRIECQSGRAVLEMETQKVSLHYWIANYYMCATGLALYRANVEHHHVLLLLLFANNSFCKQILIPQQMVIQLRSFDYLLHRRFGYFLNSKLL